MAKPTIVTRATKGSALTWTEGDANFNNLKDATVTIRAGTGGTDVISDLNGTVTLVAGTNVTLSGDNTAKTVTINASGGGGGLANVVDDTTPQLGGDLDTNGNDITAVLNADVNVAVTGTGVVGLSHGDPEVGAGIMVGNGTNTAAIFSNGATDLVFAADVDNISGFAVINIAADGAILVIPRLGSTLDVESATTRLGLGDAAATLTSNGAQNLTINTNSGSTSPAVTLTQNGGITLQATAATNAVAVVNSLFQHSMNSSTAASGTFFLQAHTTADANNFSLIRARGTTTSPAAVQTGDELGEFVVAGHDGQTGAAGYEQAWGFTTTVTDTPTSNVMPTRTDFVINTSANTRTVYHSIEPDLIFRVVELGTVAGVADLFVSAGTNGNVEIAPDGTGQVLITSAMQVSGDITAPNGSGADLTLAGDGTGNVNLNSDTVRIGDNNTAATLTTHGTGNLTLNTHDGTNSGSITITQGTNANLELTPNGTGQTQIKNLEYNEFIFSLGTTSGTVAPNVANGNVQTITLNGNLTLNAFTSPIAGQSVTLIVNTNGTGRTLTSTMKFAGGSKTLSTTNTTDIISVFYDGTTYWASLAKDFV